MTFGPTLPSLTFLPSSPLSLLPSHAPPSVGLVLTHAASGCPVLTRAVAAGHALPALRSPVPPPPTLCSPAPPSPAMRLPVPPPSAFSRPCRHRRPCAHSRRHRRPCAPRPPPPPALGSPARPHRCRRPRGSSLPLFRPAAASLEASPDSFCAVMVVLNSRASAPAGGRRKV